MGTGAWSDHALVKYVNKNGGGITTDEAFNFIQDMKERSQVFFDSRLKLWKVTQPVVVGGEVQK